MEYFPADHRVRFRPRDYEYGRFTEANAGEVPIADADRYRRIVRGIRLHIRALFARGARPVALFTRLRVFISGMGLLLRHLASVVCLDAAALFFCRPETVPIEARGVVHDFERLGRLYDPAVGAAPLVVDPVRRTVVGPPGGSDWADANHDQYPDPGPYREVPVPGRVIHPVGLYAAADHRRRRMGTAVAGPRVGLAAQFPMAPVVGPAALAAVAPAGAARGPVPLDPRPGDVDTILPLDEALGDHDPRGLWGPLDRVGNFAIERIYRFYTRGCFEFGDATRPSWFHRPDVLFLTGPIMDPAQFDVRGVSQLSSALKVRNARIRPAIRLVHRDRRLFSLLIALFSLVFLLSSSPLSMILTHSVPGPCVSVDTPDDVLVTPAGDCPLLARAVVHRPHVFGVFIVLIALAVLLRWWFVGYYEGDYCLVSDHLISACLSFRHNWDPKLCDEMISHSKRVLGLNVEMNIFNCVAETSAQFATLTVREAYDFRGKGF